MGIQRIVGDAVPDGQQVPVPIEKKAELHLPGHGAGLRLQRLQPMLQEVSRLRREGRIPPVALDCTVHGLDPE